MDKNIEILRSLRPGEAIPSKIVTMVSRIKDKPTHTPEEIELLKLYSQRTSKRSVKFEMTEEEGPSSAMAASAVYSAGIEAHKDLVAITLKAVKESNGEAVKAMGDVVKYQLRSLDNATEREELLMERLRKESKRADKYEGKFRKMQDELEALYNELEELKQQKEQASTFEKILEVGGKILAVKNGANP